MLPDFPFLKREIATRLARAAQRSAAGGPLLRELPSLRQHEGNRGEMIRTDGSVASISYDTPIEAEVTVRIDDARRQGPAASVRAPREIGEQLAAGVEQRLFETISEAVESVGNVVDGGGRPFSADMFIEMLETMELSFDEDGDWQPPTLVAHPDTLQKIKVQLDLIDTDPHIKARVETIVNRQREEWRAREARRALVD